MSRSVTVRQSYLTAHVANAARRVAPGLRLASSAEAPLLVGFLLLIFGAMLARLESVVISDMDEGTYLYAGKLIAAGAIPYQDFLLAHPPMIALLAAGWERLAGPDVMSARMAYMVLVLASTAPLYAIGRTLGGSRATGFFAVAVYTTGMLFLANMGRTVRLEPLMNAFLIGALACVLLRPADLRFRALAGALIACALLVKLVAVVPIGLFLVGDLLWLRRERDLVRSWAAMAGGAALVLIPAGLILLRLPGFLDDVVRSQVNRPFVTFDTRLVYLRQNFLRYPPIPVGLLGAAWLLLRARDPRLKIVSLVALGSTAALVLAFRTFFAYYIVQALPWLALVFAIVGAALLRTIARPLGFRWQPVLVVGALVVGVVAPVLYGEYYYRTAHDHVSSPARVVRLLREGDGYIYTMSPAFALQSGRDAYPWRYSADSLIPRLNGDLTDDGFIEAFAGSTALVLWNGELAPYPKAQAYVEQFFVVAYQDAYYALLVPREGGQR